MPRPSDREIEESFERSTGYGLALDSEDEALLRHVLLDDEPPQGLHRHGFKLWNEEEFDNVGYWGSGGGYSE